MTRSTVFGLILLGVMSIFTSAAAEPEAPAETPPPTEYRDIVTVYGGSFLLSQSSQNIMLAGPGQTACRWRFLDVCMGSGNGSPTANTFDRHTHGVFSIAYEHLFRGRWSVGATYMQMGNGYSIPALSAGKGEVTTRHLFATFDRYFREPGGLRPYIGIGIGFVVTNFFGPINPGGWGLGAQLTGGLRYQVDRLSFSAELRGIISSADFHKGDGPGVYGTLNQSGVGTFVGMGYAFK